MSEPLGIAQLLTVDEAAKYLHVSPRTCWRLVSRGDLPVVRVGTAPRVSPHDLAEYIKAHTERGGDAS